MARLWRGWLVLAALTLAWSTTVVGSAAWSAIAAHPRVMTVQLVSARAERRPAAGTPTRAARVTPGTTGTAALPALPVTDAAAAAVVAAEPGVVAARPFSMGGASGLDRARALRCLSDAVYYEAASEPDAGQRAVAQVVLNRVRHPAFPATVCGVVYQGSQGAGCQFSFACDGAMARLPSTTGWSRAERVAAAALAGYVAAPVGLATHYHTYRVTPAWNRALVMTDAVGAHFFHRWKGFWGTSAAFRQVYAGNEPLPAPRQPAVPVAVAATDAASALAPVMAAPFPIEPARADSLPSAPTPVGDHLPPAATVLPRWRDSGKPL